MVPVSLPLQEVRHEAAEARPVVRLGRHPYRSIGRCGGQQTVAAAAGEATRKHSKNGQKTSSMQRSNLMYNLIQWIRNFRRFSFVSRMNLPPGGWQLR